MPEASLNPVADRLSTLLQNLPGMAYRCLNSSGWPMEFVSDGCFDLCGYHRDEIESQSVLWGDFTHPDMIDEVDRDVRAAAIVGEPFEVEYRIITRNGIEKWVWERGRVVEMRDDGIAILEGFITDITDRKRAETALMRAEAYAQAVVETAIESIITLDDQGEIMTINKAAQQMFGYQPVEVIGAHSRIMVATDSYREIETYLNSCKNHTPIHANGVELIGVTKTATHFPIHLSISEVPDHESQRFVILIRDLTRRHAVDKQVREQRELLARVDRLNTLGEMAAGIAHEINQPLTAISMYAQSSLQFAQTQPPKIERLFDALEKLSVQAHRAGAVIERMQDMTKPGKSHQKTTDCLQLIKDVHKLAEVEAQTRNIIIVLSLDNELPEVHCDSVQIQQVILNLLRNGMEAMQAINCKSGNKIVLKAKHSGNSVTLSITDAGKGISRSLAKTLYQPFVSTKQSGMGLGLSISRSIIQAHGSELKFNNEASKGATFYFDLSSAQPSEQ
ncbi:MAG: two-component system sensor kinase FixL [Saprospiraceae bacterium]|jgi:two-component system sensor kinase FixL